MGSRKCTAKPSMILQAVLGGSKQGKRTFKAPVTMR